MEDNETAWPILQHTEHNLRVIFQWRSREWECGSCSWSGIGATAAVEPFRELFELLCPECYKRITVIPYPTASLTAAAEAAGLLDE